MSLKAIHIVFIIASSLVAIIFGVWAFGEFFGSDGEPVHLIYAAIAIAMLVALLFYGRYFLKKLKHIDYL